MAQAVIIETKTEPPSDDHPDGVLAGQQFEIASAAQAEKLYPHAKILRNADGTEYEPPRAAASTSDTKSEKKGE